MINMPKEAVFVGEDQPAASASIVLQMKPGYSLDQNQINGLYHLVSKSVPNLKEDNIVIMDQNSTYYDKSDSGAGSVSDSYASQQGIKSQVEKDIQKHVQSLLGTMMGQDKVVVSVTADIDFTKEKRTEDTVEPVDKDNMEGIAVSAEKLRKRIKATAQPTAARPEREAMTPRTMPRQTAVQTAGTTKKQQ